jgi:short-subunit dehydrogenase
MADAAVTDINNSFGPNTAVAYRVDLCDREQVYAVAKQTISDVGFVEIIINNAVSV